MNDSNAIQDKNKDGFLAIVSSPIGNLKDITYRAIEILSMSDLIAAEDTRRARILLNHYKISKEVISYHAFNEHKTTEYIVSLVLDGKKVSILSDAGTPGISDPGYLIVNKALEKGIEPLFIPGVSALSFSVPASALPADKFVFYGFLPVKSGRRGNMLRLIASENKTVFVFESTHRILKLLGEIVEIIGPDTKIAIIREATKLYEQVIRGTAGEIMGKSSRICWKGEFVVAIYPGESKILDQNIDDKKEGNDEENQFHGMEELH